MILDLEGSPAQRAISLRLGWMLPIASAAVAAALLLMIAALPHETTPRFVERGPSILEQALAVAKPTTLDLQLPADIATQIGALQVDGIYGPGRPAPKIRSFRMRASNAVVVVAMLPEAPAVVRPKNASADALSVHGVYAANYSVEATSISAIRWTEDGMTYEVSSRSVVLPDLVKLAEQVR